ncbi:MAG: hypothetical protein CM15mP106_8140 [Candidatus Neomarinimicrobiota bacterium]|nr:MAG: hypothetical protein CM15mP106_8140 [Candidatus Neomarinimicrobiota bacterium]
MDRLKIFKIEFLIENEFMAKRGKEKLKLMGYEGSKVQSGNDFVQNGGQKEPNVELTHLDMQDYVHIWNNW